MARNVNLSCDVCGKPTDAIVGKLMYVDIIPGVSKGIHSNYSHHMDVGVCCKPRLFKLFRFRKRMSAREYHKSRRGNHGNADTVAKSA